jgi:translation initiation factor IF-2
MNASKFLASATAALTVIATIGLAYAQTTTAPAPGGPIDPAAPMTQPATAEPQAMPTHPAQETQRPVDAAGTPAVATPAAPAAPAATTPATTDPAAMTDEKMARADRN